MYSLYGRKKSQRFFFSFSSEGAFCISVLLETNIPFWIFGYEFPQRSFPELSRDSNCNLVPRS